MRRLLAIVIGAALGLLVTRPATADDYSTLIIHPIREDSPLQECEQPPDDESILRLMPAGPRSVPGLCTVSRTDIEVGCERLVNRLDEPRWYPLIGSAQVHHCHWKCTVYYTQKIEFSCPLLRPVSQHYGQDIYIDRDHLHLCDEKGTKPAMGLSIPLGHW